MQMKTGLFALILGASLSTAAFAQYRPDDRSGGGYSNQGQSQSQGAGRYDPTTGGRYPADERAYRYRSRDRWDDEDRYHYRRYRDRDRYDDDRYERYDRYDRW